MNRRALTTLVIFFLTCSLFAQVNTSTLTITQSSGSVTFQNNQSTSASFTYVFSGNPTSSTVIINGCYVGGACDQLDSYAGNANSTRTPSFSIQYSYFTVTATWLGGISQVSIQVTAKITGGSTSAPASLSLFAQVQTGSAATGNCSAVNFFFVTTGGALYNCPTANQPWNLVTGGGGGLSGMTSGQVGIAGSASTITSSKPIQGTDLNLLSSGTVSGTSSPLCTDANGGATTSSCPSAGANTSLSNLSAPALNLAPSPGTDNSIALDDLTHRYTNGWLSGVLGWTNGSGAADTGLSRSAAGNVIVGNGTAGNGSGTLTAACISTGATCPSANHFSGIASLDDTNGNTAIAVTATGSAVDQITVTNAAAANPATVSIAATGTDSNININLVPKGSGTVQCAGALCTPPEQGITGATAAGTITEGGASFSVTRAGVATANLTAPWVFQNTNSTNNNTSITALFTSPGTSTGQTTININGTTGQGNLLEAGTGGTVTNGVLSGQTKTFQVSPSGTITTGAATGCGTSQTSGSICGNEGTAPTGTAAVDTLHEDSTQHAWEINNNNTGFMPIERTVCVNITPVTVAANVATDQLLQACSLSANLLNVVGRTLRVYVAGVFSTAAASTASITLKVKLCTVSGCGSGTVISPITTATGATAALTASNLAFSQSSYISTQTAGASSAYEAHGFMTIDLSATAATPDSTYQDVNTATVGTIDSTGALFVQVTAAASAASTSNSFTERQLIVTALN